ncbi:MAG: hypothetical protein KDI79_23025 [Anaerolineae bacterium]|nr:hypothetical protein [Anaerolineae bacterium]
MNAINNYVDVNKNWFDFQLKTGQDLFETLRNVSEFNPSLVWNKSVAASEASVRETLNAEVAGAQILFNEAVAVDNLPPAAVEVVKQMQGLTGQFTETQRAFVDNWFNLLKQVNFN